MKDRGNLLQSMGSKRVGHDLVTEKEQKMKYNLIYICTQMDQKNELPILIVRAGFDTEGS